MFSAVDSSHASRAQSLQLGANPVIRPKAGALAPSIDGWLLRKEIAAEEGLLSAIVTFPQGPNKPVIKLGL